MRAENIVSNGKDIWCPIAQKSTGAMFPGHLTSGIFLGRTEEDLQAVSFLKADPHQNS